MTARGWLPSPSLGGPMTAAAITCHRTFRGPSGRCTAWTGHSAEHSHRTTKVRGATQAKGSSHGLRTGGVDPLQSLEGPFRRQLCCDCCRPKSCSEFTLFDAHQPLPPGRTQKNPIHFTMLDAERRHGQIELDADRKATVPHGQLPP